MTSLTDRYVWGVLRAIPARQRDELAPEIRALVADAVEAREAAGTPSADAERAALIELGDPELLAARYTDGPTALIGPRLYPEWRRLLALLLPIVVPIATAATVVAAAIGGQGPAQLVGTGVTVAFNVAIQVVFWLTLVFALVERAGTHAIDTGAWTPDRLPDLPAPTRPGLAETVVVVVSIAVGLALLAWQQLARPIVVDGVGYALFNPDLWSFWLPWFAALLVVEAAFAVVLWRVGGYTWTLAAVNVVTGLAFLLPAVKLLQDGTLFDPGLTAAVDGQGFGPALAPAGVVLAVVMVVSQTIDIVDGFRKAAGRGRQARTA
ncbi:MAG: permease prefix domain 1-containing protein [Candidatus Limnocylindrales bacterium]